MSTSSIKVSEHSHLSQRVCDLSMEHSDTSHNGSPLAHQHSQNSCIQQHSSSTEVDEYAGKFDCNICTHVCHDPVVTVCGHLFCWPCLFSFLSLNSACKECPVCKADVQDKIVPLYGCGKVRYSMDSLAEKFCGKHIPCRPSATRWTAPITCANASQRSEMHTRPSAHLGFSAWLGTLLYILKMVASFVGILLALFRSEMHTRRSAHSSGFSAWLGTLVYLLKMGAAFVTELFGYWCSERGSTMRRSLCSIGCSSVLQFLSSWLVERRT